MKTLAAVLLSASFLMAQVPPSRTPFVRAVGQGSVLVKPDQAKIDLSVVTQASSAQAASTQNASQVAAVLNALTSLLGANADVQTVSYSLTPNYVYAQGQSPVLNGYTASNTVEVTTSNLGIVGSIIDSGIQAGANQILSLQFGLQDDTVARGQALKAATLQAKAHADAMASGLGLHTGAVQSIQEGVTATPVPYAGLAVAASTSTPIQSGTLTIQATVTLDILLQ